MFFTLAGRKVTLIKDNLVPIPDIHYALYSPAEKRYYFKEYRGWDVDILYYYRRSLTFAGEDEMVTGLRNKVNDGAVWMLYTQKQIDDTQSTLHRICKANLKGGGTLKYRDFLKLLEISLKIEDCATFHSHGAGYLTQKHIWEQELAELWKKASINKI
jgi:hypothetical protein